ncbi:hypothetical protein FSP39_016841 [Pinctada imbricata]|uniref:Chitin-binding type-2 domain-containing protein n=1 Tax=Pinctada imbricata TaxID=66713 RepID=A0AA88YDN4_PINIB|nr:hypothetical protein FSP39_016841 [Pinctada imbricata]
MFVAATAVLFVSLVFNAEASICKGKAPFEWVLDPEDCAVFYMCLNGQEHLFKCPENSVVHETTRACVPVGSVYDTCSKRERVPSLCRNARSNLVEHPESCAKFYDCTNKRSTNEQPEEKECKYPYLFDQVTKRCEHFEDAECGGRFEPISPCEYQENQCRVAHCIPCHVRFPNCKGKEDGINVWEGREGSPDYVVCKKGRHVFHGKCDDKQIFHPQKKLCVDYEEKEFY